MAVNLKWDILDPQSDLSLNLTKNDFYYSPKNFTKWINDNKNTIPYWVSFDENSKTLYTKFLSSLEYYVNNYISQLKDLQNVGNIGNGLMYVEVLYNKIESTYNCYVRILPERYVNFGSNFRIIRNKINRESDPSLYSGIYAIFGYQYASSTNDIGFYIPIKSEYADSERVGYWKDVYYADGGFSIKSVNDDAIFYNFTESTFSNIFFDDKGVFESQLRGYAIGNIMNFRYINMCNAGGDDFDGTTHENDIQRPSRSNINSTPTLPTYYSLSGISGYNLYQIPIDQLDECVSYLNSGVVISTTSNFLTWIKLLARVAQYAFLDWINNRNDYIISWKMTYYTPTVNLDLDPTINVGATSGIQIANHHITQQYDTIDCGNISIDATSFTDYEPYTYYEIYLPFVGTVPLRADTIAGRTINVKYVVDNVSNESTCIISTIDGDVEQIIHTYECNLGIDIPYKSFDYLGNIRRNASALVGAVASGASVLMKSKSNAYARSALATTSSKVRQDYLSKSVSYENIADSIPQSSSDAGYEQPQCIRSNVGSSLLSSMLPRKPYLIIRRVPMYSVNDSNRLYGRPTLEFATLDNYEGSYVKVRQVRLDGLTCTDEEKTIIQSILESGVIL